MSILKWSKLLKLHKNPPSYGLGRSPSIQKKYENYRRTESDPIGKLKERLFPRGNMYFYQFIPNDYPYQVPKNITTLMSSYLSTLKSEGT